MGLVPVCAHEVSRRVLPLLLTSLVLLSPVAVGLWLMARGGREHIVPDEPLPQRLSETGLYDEDGRIAASWLPFEPRFPLWSDGTVKRRWISLPAGARIDASDLHTWQFPVGTRFFKEFGDGQRAIETRLLERTAAGWRYATYAWDAEGKDAFLVGEKGRRAVTTSPAGAPYDLPSVADCKACHEAARVPVLGFSAYQLARESGDPLRPGVTLAGLASAGHLAASPHALASVPSPLGSFPVARAALGYLHGNCAHCHHATSPIRDVHFDLEQRLGEGPARVMASLLRAAEWRAQGEAPPQRMLPGHPDLSLVHTRMATRNPLLQMPPLGTRAPDPEGLARIEAFIRQFPASAGQP